MGWKEDMLWKTEPPPPTDDKCIDCKHWRDAPRQPHKLGLCGKHLLPVSKREPACSEYE